MGPRKRRRRATDRAKAGRATERTKTDRSLRAERKKTDDARKAHRAKAEHDADGIVTRARSAADAVLTAARSKADRGPARGTTAKRAVAGRRNRADRALEETRASADGALRGIRKHEVEAVAEVLLHERAATDADLLSERARSDAALAHRDDFLGIVAHDVRNLLNGVALNLELMRAAEKKGSEARMAACAERIRRSVARMTRLIGDLVDITSINAGRLAMDRSEVDAGAIVNEATEAFLPAAAEKEIALSAELPADPVPAELDHGRILQVLANLISNAIKFTPAGGTVTVRVDPTRAKLRFSVEDTGPGIPPSMRRAVFERFRQVGRNDRRGQGLGLYISKSIVDAHGGRIWAESAPGKGTRLYFIVPRRSPRRRRTTRDVNRRRSPDRTPPPRGRRGGASPRPR